MTGRKKTLDEISMELDRLREARFASDVADRSRWNVERRRDERVLAAAQWTAEAALWANVGDASDFPHGTAAGRLLIVASVRAEEFAAERARDSRRLAGLHGGTQSKTTSTEAEEGQ